MADQLRLRPPDEDDLTIKAGFTAEGVCRGVGWRDGQWRDGVTYSLLRTDQGPSGPPGPPAP
jgi:L-amino acid N-acyltransferase YncA